MISYEKRCVGCGACVNKCPQNCISIIRDNGQYIPIVDENKCVNCDECDSVCVVLQYDQIIFNKPIKSYYGYSKDKNTRTASSSGGVFYSIAEAFIKNGGFVVGAVYGKEMVVKHRIIETIRDLPVIRGSKYVESDLSYVFKPVRELLEDGNKVLFSGVPCQIGAIKTFLGKEYDNLFLCEVFCHGAPRSGIFKAYLSYLSKKYGKIIDLNFRSKYYGWSNPAYEIKTEKKTILEKHKDNIYHLMFGNHVSLRDSCYVCQFRQYMRSADLSLGDFWGIDKYYPNIDTKDGISAIIVNSSKGEQLLDSAEVILEKCDICEIYDKNKWMIENYEKPKEQKEFIDDFIYMENDRFIRKYILKYKVIDRIRRAIRRMIK